MISADATYLSIASRSRALCASIVVSLFLVAGCSDGSGSDNDPDISPEDEFVPFVDPNDMVPDASPLSIARNLLELSDHSVLLTLVENADLTDALDGDNDGVGWTLFAFSDFAYNNENFQTVTDEQSEAVVRLHLYEGRLNFEELRPGLLAMLAGSVEVVQNDDNTLSIGGATVIARDREFSNGIIHFVDSVLEPF